MPTNLRRTRSGCALLGASLLALGPITAGCAASRSRENENQILRKAGLAPGEQAPGGGGRDAVTGVVARPQADEAPADIQVLVGPPRLEDTEIFIAEAVGEAEATPDSEPVEVSTRVAVGLAETGFVDAVVGQINGRPVFASGFLAPMDARLRADAARLSPNQWRQQAVATIRSAIIDRMQEELVLAEFQASLTPEAKQGLFAFVERMRQEIVAQNLGSESLAGRRIQESEGLTLNEKVNQQRDREIIRAQLNRAIGSRTYVSWREVELAYARDFDLYNPAMVARLRMIQVSGAENVQAVNEALEAGESFEEIAKRLSSFRADEGGLWTIEIEREGYEATRIFAPDELNEVAVGLEVGEISESFEWSGSTIWLTLEEIVTPPGLTLYDAQLVIFERLRNERYIEERQNYLVRLFGRASVTDVAEMTERLFLIAEERYLDVPSPAPVPNGGR
jgi:hypothetical protein